MIESLNLPTSDSLDHGVNPGADNRLLQRRTEGSLKYANAMWTSCSCSTWKDSAARCLAKQDRDTYGAICTESESQSLLPELSLYCRRHHVNSMLSKISGDPETSLGRTPLVRLLCMLKGYSRSFLYLAHPSSSPFRKAAVGHSPFGFSPRFT